MSDVQSGKKEAAKPQKQKQKQKQKKRFYVWRKSFISTDIVFLELELLAMPLHPRSLPYINFNMNLLNLGVILAGRLPIWLYAHLMTKARAARFVAIFCPWMKSAVIVMSKDPNFKVGDQFPINYKELTFEE
ncbi:MAG: CRISPR-associated protein Csx3 [Candidatus Korarchaeum sp.]|nr:CRISPR-associated protein Csx3 [Candidatus Korarchaeum sp.]MDW8093366.1 CRISPR-associated protein Csx3 [Nitrososphaerota archaeon]